MKKPFIYLLTAGLAVSMITSTNTVDGATSEATIQFTSPSDSVSPVNPENPSEPNPDAEDQGTVTGEAGDLTLDFVADISFGAENTISSSEKTYYSTTQRPYIQVSDRRGTGEGWDVIASASEFTDSSGNTLRGAVLGFTGTEAVSDSTYNDPVINAPTTDDFEIITGPEGTEPAVANATPDTESMETAKGVGTWVMRWLNPNLETDPNSTSNTNVYLTVPGGAATSNSQYTSTITWTLTAGPSTDQID